MSLGRRAVSLTLECLSPCICLSCCCAFFLFPFPPPSLPPFLARHSPAAPVADNATFAWMQHRMQRMQSFSRCIRRENQFCHHTPPMRATNEPCIRRQRSLTTLAAIKSATGESTSASRSRTLVPAAKAAAHLLTIGRRSRCNALDTCFTSRN